MAKAKAKKGPGRPAAVFDLTDKTLKQILKEYQEGASDVEVKAIIWKVRGSFSNDLWDRWLKEVAQFTETIKKGRELAAAFWLKLGRKNLGAGPGDFNTTLWYMNMKNRYGWADKQETRNQHSIDGGAVKIEINKTYDKPTKKAK